MFDKVLRLVEQPTDFEHPTGLAPKRITQIQFDIGERALRVATHMIHPLFTAASNNRTASENAGPS